MKNRKIRWRGVRFDNEFGTFRNGSFIWDEKGFWLDPQEHTWETHHMTIKRDRKFSKWYTHVGSKIVRAWRRKEYKSSVRQQKEILRRLYLGFVRSGGNHLTKENLAAIRIVAPSVSAISLWVDWLKGKRQVHRNLLSNLICKGYVQTEGLLFKTYQLTYNGRRIYRYLCETDKLS